MAFNEPDNSGQSFITPSAAAVAYNLNMMPFKGKARLGAPAVTNANQTGVVSGLTWLEAFINDCSGCQIDFFPIHWYNDVPDVTGFQDHVKAAFVAGGNKPLWITEFGPNPTSGNSPGWVDFLKQVIPWLDACDMVERYAYFMCAVSDSAAGNDYLLSANNVLSDIGNTYISS